MSQFYEIDSTKFSHREYWWGSKSPLVLIAWLIKWLRRVEAVSKPRLAFLFGAVGERLIGVVILALALVLILPIPGGNILPAMAVSALAFALIQRDGVIALVGYALAVTSASVLVLAAHIIVRMFVHVWAVVTAA